MSITVKDGSGADVVLDPATAAKQDTSNTTLATLLTQSDFDTKAGALTETAPASDTASSGLNGRLQRIAQRLSSLIALLPTALYATPAAAGSRSGDSTETCSYGYKRRPTGN
jgi:hypothetical protein